MPTLLDRYILSGLLRVFGLTAVVLVTVIAFGATLKPLSDDGLFTIGDTLKYLLVAIVPMLQFALPFSAGFASTIVLHRMTSDNEIVAAAASGMSYRRLLAPLLALGLVLTLVMILLTQWAIPRFAGVMERMVTADVPRVFQASIDRGQPFQIGNLQIYADNMWVVANPSDTQAETRLVLSRVAAAELDSSGRIETDVTANQAVVDIYRIEGQIFLKLVLNDAVAFDGSPGQLARVPRLEPDQAILIPSAFRDDLRAMTRNQLLRLRQTPDLHGRVLEERLALAEAIRNVELWSFVDDHLRTHGQLELVQTGPTERRYVLRADGIEDGRLFRNDSQPMNLQRFQGNALERSIDAAGVRLARAGGAAFTQPLFELQLNDAVVTDHGADGAVNRREQLVDHNLSLANVHFDDLSIVPSAELLAYSDAIERPASSVRRSTANLRDRISRVNSEITGRLHNRYAQSATVLLLLLIGAVLAMWLRGTLPLVIYIWAFAPSVAALILASGGEKMIRDGATVSGFAVMWSGNITLLVILVVCYVRLARN